MGVRGDFALLDRLANKLAGSLRLRSEIQKRAGEAAIKLLAGEFRASKDPYGAKWRPLAHPRDAKASVRLLRRASRANNAASILTGISRAHANYAGLPLVKSGRLRNSFHYATGGPTGFTLGTNVRYAALHQYGGVVTAKARTNRHAKSGRFQSAARAGRQKGGAVRVSISHAHSFRMPQRRMVPQGRLGPYWAAAFRAVAIAVTRPYFARR